jgi:hypothetical protein
MASEAKNITTMHGSAFDKGDTRTLQKPATSCSISPGFGWTRR